MNYQLYVYSIFFLVAAFYSFKTSRVLPQLRSFRLMGYAFGIIAINGIFYEAAFLFLFTISYSIYSGATSTSLDILTIIYIVIGTFGYLALAFSLFKLKREIMSYIHKNQHPLSD